VRPQRTGLLLLVASAALVVAAIAGGAVALTGAALIWGIGTSSSAAPAQPASTGDAGVTTAGFRRVGQSLTIGQIYQRARPGVVRVSTETVVRSSDPFGVFPTMAQEQRGLGSGFVVDKSGYIVTNYHVIQGAQRIRVSFSNNESMAARLVGRDPSTDVAVLKVSAESRALRPLELGDSDGVQVGDAVVAIGNPLGYERTVTSGIVSATGRAIQAPNQSLIDQVIQTDAAINQGNSGGPLLNTSGRVIGVNTQIATENGGNVGLGFAIPINTVKDVASQIIDKGSVEHAQLGIYAQAVDARIARVFHLPARAGLLVADVDPGSGAARAGIRAGTQHVTLDGETYVMGGDLVVAADGRSMRTVEALREVVSAKSPGDAIRLDLYRGTTKHTVRVKLGRQPSSPRG
jgi:S1-C subfamily serine protease